jgi:hypothetical protein
MSLLPNTEKTHHSYAACGRKVNTDKDSTETQGTMISHYLDRKEKRESILEFKRAVPLPLI